MRKTVTLQIGMTVLQQRLGWIYLLVQQLFLPSVLSFLNSRLPVPLNTGTLNFVFFAVNFLCVLAIFHVFLRQSLEAAVRTPGRLLRAVGIGLVFYYAATSAVSMLILQWDPTFFNVNDTGIADMLKEERLLMSAGTVLLVPVVEETLFRGLIFRELCGKSRQAAYLVSACLFAAIHVTGYIGLYRPMTLTLCFLQYIPAGIWLAWSYAAADTIIAPILIHTIINAIGILTMR